MKKTILIGLFICFSIAVQAQLACYDLFITSLQKRQTIAQTLLKSQITSIAKPTQNGLIPVILGNIKNFDDMKSLYDKSIGIIVQHQPDYRNDHGMYRLGLNYIDMDSPGYRHRGELHQTGLAWIPVKDFLQYSFGRQSSVRIEVLYKLNESDFNTAYAYQAMRRAAIVRVPFTFGGGKQNFELSNMLVQGGENCFSFCSGTSLRSQIQEMANKLSADGYTNMEVLMQDKTVQNFLSDAKQALISADPNSSFQLNSSIALNLVLPAAIANSPVFSAGGQSKKAEILNWMIGYKLSTGYHALLEKLGVSGGNGFDGINSKEASAIVIYDGSQTKDSFQTKNYVSKGIFSTWTQQDAQDIKTLVDVP